MPNDTLTIDPPKRLLLSKALRAKLGGVRSETIWRWTKERDFPKPIKLNPTGRLLGWVEAEVEQWLENQQRGRGDPTPQAVAAAMAINAERHRRANGRRQPVLISSGGLRRMAPLPER